MISDPIVMLETVKKIAAEALARAEAAERDRDWYQKELRSFRRERDEALARADKCERDWYDAKAEFGRAMARAHNDRDEARAALEHARNQRDDLERLAESAARSSDEARSALSRWAEVVDDVCGIQPVSPPDELMSTLAKRVFGWRQRIAALEAALRVARSFRLATVPIIAAAELERGETEAIAKALEEYASLTDTLRALDAA